MTSRSSRAS